MTTCFRAERIYDAGAFDVLRKLFSGVVLIGSMLEVWLGLGRVC
jgi:hypothetical protein